jgi:hypothetical protein
MDKSNSMRFNMKNRLILIAGAALFIAACEPRKEQPQQTPEPQQTEDTRRVQKYSREEKKGLVEMPDEQNAQDATSSDTQDELSAGVPVNVTAVEVVSSEEIKNEIQEETFLQEITEEKLQASNEAPVSI